MGMGIKDNGGAPPAQAVRIPSVMVSFLNRVMALPSGIHVIYVVKTEAGGSGLAGWSVDENKMERPRLVEGEGQGIGEGG